MNTFAPIIPFAFGDQLFRAMDRDGQVWFAGADACAALGLDNVSQALSTLEEDEKITLTNSDGNPRAGIPHQLALISEPGLYRLIFKSRKPAAKALQRFVFHEVLPSIRRTGSYQHSTPDRELAPHELFVTLIREQIALGVDANLAARCAAKMVPAAAPEALKIKSTAAASHPHDAELDEILALLEPGRGYTIPEVVALLPARHRLRRGSRPAQCSAAGKILTRAVRQQRLERDPDFPRTATFRLPQIADFSAGGE